GPAEFSINCDTVAKAFNTHRVNMTALVVAAVSLLGCVSLQAASSGQIGCSEDEITITDDDVGWSSRTWTATCRGKRFFCTAVSTGKDSSQVNCKEEAGSVARADAPAPKAKSGCEYDNQCKGDRVCVKGACVAPEASSTSEPATSTQ
ncbi:MAG TPA: hypothetical protein VHO25_08235, partial [Polyangiaceae bacterium]|nr:hypothetical protein [Polyangiaceae bacterium]